MKNEILRRLSALALGLALLLNAAPLPQAFAVEDDTDASSSDSADSTDTADKTAVTTADSDPTVTAAAANAPALDATAALLVSPESDMVLYEKNADEKRYPASTTKIMTALLTLENISDLSVVVTAEASDFENVTSDSSNAGIKVGEQVTVKDLLYALMLPSANEAAYMLARHVGGSWEQFVDMMNERAAELGCTGTHFCNPCGLHEDDHYTTAHDLYLIAKEAMKDATFRDIVSTVQHRMAKTNLHDQPADLQLVPAVELRKLSRHQDWPHLAGRQLLRRLRRIRRRKAVLGRARLLEQLEGIPDRRRQLHRYQEPVPVGL